MSYEEVTQPVAAQNSKIEASGHLAMKIPCSLKNFRYVFENSLSIA
jgi:hypothetical protein